MSGTNALRGTYALLIALVAVTVFTVGVVADAEAAGRFGGGAARSGGFNRSSVAAGGSFSARGGAWSGGGASGARQGQRQDHFAQQQGSRQDAIADRQGTRQDAVADRQGTRQDSTADRQQDRRDDASKSREDWQDHMNDAREDRQDFVEDELDDHYDHDWDDDWGDVLVAGAVIAGTAAVISAATTPHYVYYSTLPCTTTATIVNGITYYHCGSLWYSQVYAGSAISYTVVQAPAGY